MYLHYTTHSLTHWHLFTESLQKGVSDIWQLLLHPDSQPNILQVSYKNKIYKLNSKHNKSKM